MHNDIPEGFISEVIERHNVIMITFNPEYKFNDPDHNDYFLTGKAIRKYIINNYGTAFNILANKRSDGLIVISK